MERALLVDDNLKILDQISRTLDRLHVSSVLTHEPQEAIHLAQKENFDYLFADLDLDSKIDGIDVAIEFNNCNPGKPISIVTGNASKDRFARRLDLIKSIKPVIIEKPINNEKISRFLETSRSHLRVSRFVNDFEEKGISKKEIYAVLRNLLDTNVINDVLLMKDNISILDTICNVTNGKEDNMNKDYLAYKKLHNDLVEKYSGEFVALYNGEVICHGRDRHEVLITAIRTVGDFAIYITKIDETEEKIIICRPDEILG